MDNKCYINAEMVENPLQMVDKFKNLKIQCSTLLVYLLGFSQMTLKKYCFAWHFCENVLLTFVRVSALTSVKLLLTFCLFVTLRLISICPFLVGYRRANYNISSDWDLMWAHNYPFKKVLVTIPLKKVPVTIPKRLP